MGPSVTTVLIVVMGTRLLAITRKRYTLSLLKLDRMLTLKSLRSPLQSGPVIRIKSIGSYGLGDLRLILLGLLAGGLSVLEPVVVIAVSGGQTSVW